MTSETRWLRAAILLLGLLAIEACAGASGGNDAAFRESVRSNRERYGP